MEEKSHHSIIPPQQEGSQSNTESKAQFEREEEAKQFYETVKKRLLNVNDWQQFAGAATAHFQLTDEKGNAVQRTVQKSDYFKIDIPGPGSVSGEGYDWVRVESIEEHHNNKEDITAIRVRPASNPTNERKDVAHFFSEEATSTFMATRKGTEVSAEVHGRNEKPNSDTETTTDKARNTMVALGATAFSKLQWKSLVNGLVKK